MRILNVVAVIGAVLPLASVAHASPVTIDVGTYGNVTGLQWVPVAQPPGIGWSRGTMTADFAPGDYTMYLSNPGQISFPFSVTAGGAVTTTDTTHATAAGTTLSFIDHPVNIDVPSSGYRWVLSQGGSYSDGDTSTGLVTGSYDFYRYNFATFDATFIGTINVPVNTTGWSQTILDGANPITFSAVAAPEPASIGLLAFGVLA